MTDVSLALGEVTLRGTVTGAGPTVLLLHAGGERRGVWMPVAARMSVNGLRTVAYDLRGHGGSSGRATSLRAVTEDVIEMVAREPAPIVMVGASLGGFAAIAALAEPPVAERVAGLVLVDVVPDPDPDRVRAWLGARGLLDPLNELVEDILGSGPELLEKAAALDLPILLARGERSPLPDADAERLRAANRRVTVATVPGAGHLVARDAPAELARVLSAHATTWLGTDDVVRRAFELQRELGAAKIDHPGGTLLAHLRRVHALTVEWNASPRVRLAAICHATYGTAGFPHALLPIEDRQRLQDVIGTDAEALVHLYGTHDRAEPLPATDRRDFAVLTIANELDVARHAGWPEPALDGIRRMIGALGSHAPREAARALADEALTRSG
ncbi:alpha/beta fold hydrolase [Nonomuraea sp. NPDC050556]|uniref:alpha/beta fold hydrolase n=1 Tax=Nonomuraea sp. NPDC050556 TaxID=3364369 RepID=UPI0037ADE4CD